MWREFMNRCTKPVRVQILKSEAREHHEAYTMTRIEWRMARGLQASDVDEVGAEMARHRVEFNRAMDQLAAIDPNAPKYRLGNWVPK